MAAEHRNKPSAAKAHDVAAPRIEDYALIGNMQSAALVSREGSIDWLCLPRFDSPACFAMLVGSSENGRWKIAPAGAITRSTRCYRPDSAILETRFETPTGVAVLTDFMPVSDDEERVDVVRIVRCESGFVDMRMDLVLRFGNGEAVPWVRRRDYGLSAVAGADAVELHAAIPTRGEGMTTVGEFTVREGEQTPMTLSYHPSHKTPHFIPDRAETLERTASWWREWIKRASFENMPEVLREPVTRSLITLKLLTYAPTGGIVAAPTTSLPERIGGDRNWDYRYCWLRDSSLGLYALLNAGYREEAEAWRQWLLRAVAGHPQQLQIMYGIAGERWLPEMELPWLAGYQQSPPVRIGNDAARQLQLDVFGELMDTLHAARDSELQSQEEAWLLQRVLLDHLESRWQTLDYGLWEVRGPPCAFTHSRMMCWVAFDRAVLAVERHGLEGPVDHWRALRETIHDEICTRGFNKKKNSFVQHYDSDVLDASLLLMPQLGFLPADDPRVAGTISAIERELMRDGFVRRYATAEVEDGVGGDEGAFLACSFWLVDAYVLSGRLEDARKLFGRLLDIRNDVGLLAEEYDPKAGRLLGNFPQAYSHIGLINAAHNLVKHDGPARQRSKRVAIKHAEPVSNAVD
jgi:GH15 family glucan-1,4-alpha-glucosidase